MGGEGRLWGEEGNQNIVPGGSGLHISGQFLEVRGERSDRDCAEMERGVNQAMERCRRRVKRCVCVCVHARMGIVIMILPTMYVLDASDNNPLREC